MNALHATQLPHYDPQLTARLKPLRLSGILETLDGRMRPDETPHVVVNLAENEVAKHMVEFKKKHFERCYRPGSTLCSPVHPF